MIYFDPSEEYLSRTWEQLFRELDAESWDGLEQATGADMLVLPESVPTVPAMLRRYQESSVLVQRKSASDLTHSIPRLDEILQRMLEHTNAAYLLTVGNFMRIPGDETININGRDTQWTYPSFSGAITRWQMRGGMVWTSYTEDEAAAWLNTINNMVCNQTLWENHIVRRRAPMEGGIFDEKAWRVTLSTLPGLGAQRVDAIADQFDTLNEAMSWLLVDQQGIKIPGVGKKTIAGIQEYFGREVQT